MSKVTVEINEYVCTALEYLRKMRETGDYSQLPAIVERIQQHVNAMEAGLDRTHTLRYHIGRELKDKEKSDTDKLKSIEKEFNRLYGDKNED